MWRALRFIVLLGAAAWTAVWLADHPGSATLYWQGYRIDTTFAVVVAVVAAVVVMAALLYRLWLFLRRVPERLGQARREGRRRRGYLALTRGMVAVAAGDGEEAGRQVKRADVLLGDPALTMLLSAQSAQLGGDEKAAEGFFRAMLERPETEFLGVRGLLTQAIKRRDHGEALRLARRAYRLKPKSEWVAGNLFEQQVRRGQWTDAEITLGEAMRNRLVASDRGRRRGAVIGYQRSIEAQRRGQAGDAQRLVRKAHELDAGFIPAAVRLAHFLTASGKPKKAAQVVERTWRREPHPDLLESFRAAHPDEDPLRMVPTVQQLAGLNPDHPESHIAIAEVALEAKLWGEARRHLIVVAGDNPAARVCRLMARLEESEHGDMAAAREWLMRASLAEPDPAWVCDHCGNSVAEWTALCGNCGDFDTFSWRTPPSVVSLPGPAREAATPAIAAD